MKYPKKLMTIKELIELGFTDDELRYIYRNRAINQKYKIASKMRPDAPNSTIKFDTDALEKYRQSLCTGE